MRIYPVLDIQKGIVVHAVRGERDRYRPLQSAIAGSADPLAVARALRDRFGMDVLYVADLDALGGAPPAEGVLRTLLLDGFRLMVDSGVRSVEEAIALGQLGVDDIVVALETLPDPDHLSRIIAEVGAGRIIFSLDLQCGVPITRSGAWGGRPADAIALEAFERGVRRMIVLDLTSVGTGEGPARQDLLRSLRRNRPEVELITGGGVRSRDDLELLRTLGMNGVLVATALHRGALSARDLSGTSHGL